MLKVRNGVHKGEIYTRELLDRSLQLEYISTSEMLAERLTKVISAVKNEFINVKLGIK